MHVHIFAKAIAIAVLMSSCAIVAAKPIVCNPNVAFSPPSNEAGGSFGWLGGLISGPEETKPFSGSVQEGQPDPGCSIAAESRSVASTSRRISRRQRSLN